MKTGARLFFLGLFLTGMFMTTVPLAAYMEKTPYYNVPEKEGRWIMTEREIPIKEIETQAFIKLKRDEVQRIRENYKKVWNIFRKAPPLNPPKGFEVEQWGPICYLSRWLPGVLECSDEIKLYAYTKNCPTCKVYPWKSDAGGPFVAINTIEALGLKEFWKDEEGPIYGARKIIGEVAGFPVYLGQYNAPRVVITKIKRPFFVPVSNERYLRYLIKYYKGAPLAKDLEQELESLSPTERASQAYYSGQSKRKSLLANPNTPGAIPLVAPNKDFFNPKLPRTSMQVLVIYNMTFDESNLKNCPELREGDLLIATCHFLMKTDLEITRTLDWKALYDLLEE